MGGSTGFKRCRRNARRRKGAMVVLVAITFVIFLVAAAFSVDMAYMFLACEQLHVATDAAAKAAVTGLSQGQSQTQAIQSGITCAAANTVGNQPLTLTTGNVVLGGVTYSSSGYWTFSPAAVTKTAAQVTGQTPVSLFFGRVFGVNSFLPTKSSTAAFIRNKWCFVFDRSGSMCFDMSGNDWYFPSPIGYLYGYPRSPYSPHPTLSRLANLCTGANTFLTTLTSSPGGTGQNQVGMVTFANTASSDCTFSSSYSAIQNKLSYYISTNIYNDGIYNGGTNLASGLQAAINLFSSTDDGTPWNKVIIVLSDGQWNQGSDPLSLVSTLNSNGIVVHTVGLLSGGSNYTMQQLAAQTNGLSLMANSGQELQDAFTKLARTIPVILTQ